MRAVPAAPLLLRRVPPAPPVAPPRPRPFGLTPREIDVLDLYAQGYDYHAIARALAIRRGTVVTHLRRLRAQIGVPDELSFRAACTLWGRHLAGDPDPLGSAWWAVANRRDPSTGR